MTPPAGYVIDWTSGFPVADKNPDGDPGGDGIANLLEYVLDGNPGARDPSILPAASVGGGAIRFSFKRLDASRSDTVLVFQYSTDLHQWTDVEVPAASAAVGGASVTVTPASPADAVIISIPAPELTGGRQFGRLLVIKP